MIAGLDGDTWDAAGERPVSSSLCVALASSAVRAAPSCSEWDRTTMSSRPLEKPSDSDRLLVLNGHFRSLCGKHPCSGRDHSMPRQADFPGISRDIF